MNIQEIFDDVKERVETARKQSRDAFKAYVDTQRKALDVVSDGARSLARTEIDAAKDVYAAARSSFDQARRDGVRQVASKPRDYLPASRETLVSAYEDTLDLLAKTGDELSKVVNRGYRNVRNKLTGKKPAARKVPAKRGTAAKRKATTKRKTASTAARKSTAKSGAAKTGTRKTAAARKTTTS